MALPPLAQVPSRPSRHQVDRRAFQRSTARPIPPQTSTPSTFCAHPHPHAERPPDVVCGQILRHAVPMPLITVPCSVRSTEPYLASQAWCCYGGGATYGYHGAAGAAMVLVPGPGCPGSHQAHAPPRSPNPPGLCKEQEKERRNNNSRTPTRRSPHSPLLFLSLVTNRPYRGRN